MKWEYNSRSDSSPISLKRSANELGLLGWELVSVSAVREGFGTEFYAFFKRPLK